MPEGVSHPTQTPKVLSMERYPDGQESLAQWKLVRSAIEHENTLISHRVTWFLATQLFLFAGFSSIFVKAIEKDSLFGSAKVYSAFVIISCIGIWICILAWANMRAAGKMIGRLRDWWIMNCHPKNKDFEKWRQSVQFNGTKSLPPVNGMFTDNLLVCFSEKRLPAAIAMCWLLLLVMTTGTFIHRRPELFTPCVLLIMTFIALPTVASLEFIRREVQQWLVSDNIELKQELIDLHEKIHNDHETSSD
jgi:hypothetical protein